MNDERVDVQDDAFCYEGYQIVHGEFFAHIHEPSLTFNSQKVSVNSVCLRKLPDTHFVQFLVNPEMKKLLIRPCTEDAKDAVGWHTLGSSTPKPKQITCRVFFAKIFDLMQWNKNHRYKLLGKLIRSCDESVFVFDLTASEIYQRILKVGDKPVALRTPVFPEDWKHQFGVPDAEHRQAVQVKIFQGYAVFALKDMGRDVEGGMKPIEIDELNSTEQAGR